MVTKLEFNGSTQFKDINEFFAHVLCVDRNFQRLACEHFDKGDGSKLIRMQLDAGFSAASSDPPNKSSCPHLVAVLVNK